ncbi:MAG: sialidase, partial [Gemmatimonadetes bacterium]|nr:sialidase [Gemmatimonadota bacterium]
EDPQRPGLLYAGTENALYVSLDDGDSWRPLQSNLPPAPVHWLTIQPHFNDLVVATYGRGFWIADDVTPLQQITPDIASGASHLFAPRPAYRFLPKASAFSQPGDPAAGSNPPSGASLSYWLGADAEDVSLEIVDGTGSVVAEVATPRAGAGVNRAHWSLAYTPSRRPTLRTRPRGHSHVALGADGTRPAPDGGRVVPRAEPGTYTVRLTVDGVVHEQRLEVRMDPSSLGSREGIRAQQAMLLELRDEANRVVSAIDSLEVWRAETLERDPGGALIGELDALTHTLYDLRLSGGTAGQDGLRWPRQLFAKITSLAGYLGGTDFAPTAQAREVHTLYRERLREVEVEVARLRARVRGIADGPQLDEPAGGAR